MKTIEEAVKEYAKKCPHGVWRDDAELAFSDGVKFAEEWVLVKDELPSAENGYIEDELLIKDNRGTIAVGRYYGDKNGAWGTSDELIDAFNIVEWRPINRK